MFLTSYNSCKKTTMWRLSDKIYMSRAAFSRVHTMLWCEGWRGRRAVRSTELLYQYHALHGCACGRDILILQYCQHYGSFLIYAIGRGRGIGFVYFRLISTFQVICVVIKSESYFLFDFCDLRCETVRECVPVWVYSYADRDKDLSWLPSRL